MGLKKETTDGGAEPAVDHLLFREVLASFPAGVVIVTATDDDGVPAGVTVSAFCSVSMDPTLVLVCIDDGSRTLHAVRAARSFTVNILRAGREDLALAFASKRDDKFAGVSWEQPAGGVGGPVMRADAGAYLACAVHEEIEAGDHWIFVGKAVEAGMDETHPHLLYHRRSFSEVG